MIATRRLLLAGLVVALVVAGVLSLASSASPDGLSRVAGDLGFASTATASGAESGPLAGYQVAGVGDSRFSGGLAGVLGCLVVLALSTLLFRLRGSSRPASVPPRHRREGE